MADTGKIVALIKAQVRGYNIAQGDLTEEQIRSITTVEAEREALRNLSKTVEKAELSLLDVSETLAQFTGSIMDVYKSGREVLLMGLGNIFTNIAKVVRSVGRAFANTFDIIAPERINGWIMQFEEITSIMILTNKQCRTIRRTVQKLLRPIKELTDIAKEAVTALMPFATDLFVTGFKLVTGTMWILGDVAKYVAEGIHKLRDAASKNVIAPLGAAVKEKVLPHWENLKSIISELPKHYRNLKKQVALFGNWSKVGQEVSDAFGSFKNSMSTLFDFKKLFEVNQGQIGLLTWASLIRNEFVRLGTAIKDAFTNNTQIDEFLNSKLIELDELLGGLPIEDGILWCATEKNTKAQLDEAVAVVKEVLAK